MGKAAVAPASCSVAESRGAAEAQVELKGATLVLPSTLTPPSGTGSPTAASAVVACVAGSCWPAPSSPSSAAASAAVGDAT